MANELDVNNNQVSDDDDFISLSQSSVESVHFMSDEECLRGLDYKVFNDSIHGHILIHPLLVLFIDTPQFQRLRNIKQLGATYFVYPGASHNRFEHCIGTAYLAGALAKLLRTNQKNLQVTDVDILCVELAGLCHDLGHGPFSHMFDGNFLPLSRPGYQWTHEKGSCMMLDHMIEENDLWPHMEKYDLSPIDVEFIKELIRGPADGSKMSGKWNYRGRGEEKSFLYEIVSNERNKVDVDKWDYFARDCHHLGINNSFDHKRFMRFIRVLKVEGERLQICARDKESLNLYEMFHTRSVLHRRAYQHRVAKAIDLMICEAMLIADEHITFTGTDGRKLKISETVDDPVAYLKLTDEIFNQILHSTSDDLKKAREILNRILRRNIYKFIGSMKRDHVRKEDLVSLTQDIILCDSEGKLKAEDLVVDAVNVSYGMKEKNPIDSFRFFSKKNPRKPYHIRKEDVSFMLPAVFEEHQVIIYCKDVEKIILAQKCFGIWCKKKNIQPKLGLTDEEQSLTPMKRNSDRKENVNGGKKMKF